MLDAMLRELLTSYAHPDGPGASAAAIRDGQFWRATHPVWPMSSDRFPPRYIPITGSPRSRRRLRRWRSCCWPTWGSLTLMIMSRTTCLHFRCMALPSAFAICSTTHPGCGITKILFQPVTRIRVHDRDVLALLATHDQLYFPPGDAFRYSNSGYVMLALLVEAVTGTSFARFLHEHIFAPLGMRATVAHEEGISVVPQRAWGYTVTRPGVERTDQSPTSATLGDGGIYSSVADLAAWTHALATLALVRPATWHHAITPSLLADGTRGPYGFGWFVEHDELGMLLWHHGETMGFTNGIACDPARDLAVAVLTNRTGGSPWHIARHVLHAWRASTHERL